MLLADLKAALEYDPATGLFRWRESRGRQGVLVGAVAGFRTRGYVYIGIHGRRYAAHRLAWLYMTGEWPAGDIDHKSRKRDDNSWDNLREATRSQNIANSCAKRDGLKGVTFDRSRGLFAARIKVLGRTHNLGRFKTPEEAHQAYVTAAEKYFGEFARAA